jgi:hypothetical protein
MVRFFILASSTLNLLIDLPAIYNYIFDYKKKNFWLLISAVLFVLQIDIFFINKYYFPHEIFRKTTIILFGASHFTFYKFMILNEGKKINHNLFSTREINAN